MVAASDVLQWCGYVIMQRHSSRGYVHHGALLFAVALIAGILHAESAAAKEVRLEGWAWVDLFPVNPTIDVPTNGFIDLGIPLQGIGDCLNAATILDSVSVAVTNSAGVVLGNVTLSGGISGRENLRWVPESNFAPNTTYQLTVTADNAALGADGCVTTTLNVTKNAAFTTDGGPATGPPAAMTSLELTHKHVCAFDSFEGRFTYDDAAYVTYIAFDRSWPRHVRAAGGSGAFIVHDIASDYCLTLRGTHVLTGESSDTTACVADATKLEPAVCASTTPDDLAGCNAVDGVAGPTLPAALLLLTLVLGAVRRRLAWLRRVGGVHI